MTAYQRDVQLPRGSSPRFYHKKKDLESSMLQYSERMRVISAARVSLGDGLEALERLDSRGTENELGWSNRNGAFMDRRTIQKQDQTQNKTRHLRDDSLPQIGPTISKPRRQRPSSFDEKELQHNISIVQTRRRPYSFDERELKRNEAANAELRLRHRREAFTEPARPIVIPTSNSSEDSPTTQNEGEVRISFVNASDLYELVDINRQIKGNQRPGSRDDSIKLLNVPDAVRFVQNFEAKKEGSGLRGESLSLQRKPDPKSGKNQLEKNRFASTSLEFNTHRASKTEHKNTKKGNKIYTEVETVTPLSIFLQQAASDYASQNALSVRPKRAKRMSLRKPGLLDIPETEDSTLKPVCHDKIETTRTIRRPSRTSLEAIKEVREDKRDESSSLEIVKTTQRSRQKDVIRVEEPLPNKISPRKSKSKQKIKTPQPDLDIDKLLMTSIYPTVPWDPDQGSSPTPTRHFALPEKNSHKEKAHRKMKKLFFLRDRPDQHYRRDT
ncbi:hypothetical protein ElyMa_006335900 [Elysia marginata]|uniref:Shugoshin C-terminal domain-containing protein n=1 Tax=Elysia marginata TaxID=1093978 RepID=A0AAV4HJS7_9GAST|nr:hypothetical protein ElyMa_006335900 [Elysia marginata]